MSSSSNLLHRWSHPMGDASDALEYRRRQITRHPGRAGGIIVLGLLIFGFIWMFPELRRYLHMKRM